MAALFAKKHDGDEPVHLEIEAEFIAQLNSQAYSWLGSRYLYYNKIRSADKNALNLFKGRNLEELMEATRSALALVTKTVNGGLATAFNNTVDMVKNAGTEPEIWPAKQEVPDRGNPPTLTNNQDALIIAWMPLKFLNMAKMVRDKGKGLDFYAEGLVKKLYFKVVGYYSDPKHWNADRLAFNLTDLPDDATLLDVNNKLSVLKTELEMFAAGYQLFKFGGSPRTGADAGTRNALEETIEFPESELVTDLYFQNFIIQGLEQFLVRYLLTLLSAVKNPIALRPICQIFEPALAKALEVRVQFQGSFMMEREKIRLRRDYVAFTKKMAALPVVEMVEEKGRQVRKINYSTKLLDIVAYAHHPEQTERQKTNWAGYLRKFVLDEKDPQLGYGRLTEVLHTLVRLAQNEFDGQLKVVEALREFAESQEKMGLAQIKKKERQVADAKRKKLISARKFKSMEQFDMVKTIEGEAEAAEQEGLKAVEKMQQSVEKRKEAFQGKAQQMEVAALERGQRNAPRGAATVFAVIENLDSGKKMQAGMVGYLLQNIQQNAEATSPELFRHLFTILPGLAPTQKIMLRKALEGKMELNEDDLAITEEELRAYGDQITNRKTELSVEAPGTLEQKLNHGTVTVTVDKLLGLGLTAPSMQLLLQMPMSAPQKAAAKLPPGVVQKLMQLNMLMNPFPELDLILPNVPDGSPPAKRLNFNRLSKAL